MGDDSLAVTMLAAAIVAMLLVVGIAVLYAWPRR
jgi:hypothetical protein